jgi:hypothetical protein
MTHTLHRLGTPENLTDDYVVLAMSAKGLNEEGAAEGLREFLRIAMGHKPVNMGDMKTGNMYGVDPSEIMRQVKDTSIVHVVFTDIMEVEAVLREVKEANLGMSIVVSGLFDPIRKCLELIGQEPSPHTIEYSLGVWGRTERLPERGVLEISTMCGHGMVGFDLVKNAVEDLRVGRATERQVAMRLSKPCVCGVFNPARACHLARALADE